MMKVEKRNAILSAVGDRSLHRHWVRDRSNFDTYLVYYGDNPEPEGYPHYALRAKGYKYHLLKKLLEDRPELYRYNYLWLPDDDVHLDTASINRLFGTMAKYNLQLAQPSISGYYGVEITLPQKGSILRYTNWVEIMCPCFSSDALKKCSQSFTENNTGWGIEMMWNKLLGHPRDKIAIIDDIVAVHTRPVLTGDTYHGRENPLDFAMSEAKALVDKYDLAADMDKDLPHGTPVVGEVWGSVMYGQIVKEMEDGVPKPERFWPPCGLLEHAIRGLAR